MQFWSVVDSFPKSKHESKGSGGDVGDVWGLLTTYLLTAQCSARLFRTSTYKLTTAETDARERKRQKVDR